MDMLILNLRGIPDAFRMGTHDRRVILDAIAEIERLRGELADVKEELAEAQRQYLDCDTLYERRGIELEGLRRELERAKATLASPAPKSPESPESPKRSKAAEVASRLHGALVMKNPEDIAWVKEKSKPKKDSP